MSAFRTQRVITFEVFTVPIDGKVQVIRNGDAFCKATMLFAIIKVFVMAWAGNIFGGF